MWFGCRCLKSDGVARTHSSIVVLGVSELVEGEALNHDALAIRNFQTLRDTQPLSRSCECHLPTDTSVNSYEIPGFDIRVAHVKANHGRYLKGHSPLFGAQNKPVDGLRFQGVKHESLKYCPI